MSVCTVCDARGRISMKTLHSDEVKTVGPSFHALKQLYTIVVYIGAHLCSSKTHKAG